MKNQTETPRSGRRWRLAAGSATAAAVLLMTNTTAASAAPAGPPTPTQTLSTGAYSWHVATSSVGTVDNPDGATGPLRDGAPLHGEFPIVMVDGTVQVRRWQWGTVTAVSAGTVTVASEDGYTSRYGVDSDKELSVDLDAVTVGDLVTVVGVVEARGG